MNQKYKRNYYQRHRNPLTHPLHTRPWVHELLKLESFTAAQAGELAGLWGRDAIDRLRQSPSLDLIVLGKDPNATHYRTTLYKVRLREKRTD